MSITKNRLLLLSIIGVIIACGGVFFWHTHRQKTYAKTRALFAPYYTYSGKLTPEQQKSYTEYIVSITEGVKPSDLRKYKLPKRERLQLEAHSMALLRDNPELVFRGPFDVDKVDDIRPYQMHFGILALKAKTKLADIPSNSRSQILKHLESLNRRLTINRAEAYIEKIQKLSPGPNFKLPPLTPMTFWLSTIKPISGDKWIMEADGSFHLPEGGKLGSVHITDTYGNEYTVDFDAPTDISMTEDTEDLYTEIDTVYEHLIDTEFHRLSTLSKSNRYTEIEELFSAE